MSTLLLVAACNEPSRPVGALNGGPVVTLFDYFELGEQRVAQALADAGDADGRITAARAAAWGRAVVRLRIHFNFQGESSSTMNATATLIDGGAHAITAGHAAIVAFEQEDARVELALDTGRVLAARVRPLDHYDPARPVTDWAVLDVVDPPAGLPALELGSAEPGEQIVLGFPARCGLGADDRVALDHDGRSSRLRPLRILCRAEQSGSSVDIVAGAVPLGGISGAPCIDVAGRVVGIQHAVIDSISQGETRWTLEIVPLDGLRALLAR